jgi:hypothetical protein
LGARFFWLEVIWQAPNVDLNLTDATKADTLIRVCRWSTSVVGDDLMQLISRTDRRSNTDRRGCMRGIAAFVATILLLAQSVGVAHLHPLPSQQKYVATSAVSVDGLCALCLVRFHSPAAFVVTPHPTAPALAELTVLWTTDRGPRSAYRSHPFGRAPPASV